MSYPNLPIDTASLTVSGDDTRIVSLPNQPTTSLRFNMTVTEGQNLILKNVGTMNATYASEGVAEQSVALPVGTFYSVTQPVVALCVKPSGPITVNLLIGGQGTLLNVTKMLFIDEELDGFEINNPTSSTATDVQAALFYVLKPQ